MLQHNGVCASIKLSWYRIGAMADKCKDEPGGEKTNGGKRRKKRIGDLSSWSGLVAAISQKLLK